MKFLKNLLFATPWHCIRSGMVLAGTIPMAVYIFTLCTYVYPGESALLSAAAAGLCERDDLAHPLFSLIVRHVAALPFAELPYRLNLFCAICGGVAIALFYLMTARLVFLFACEDPGGSIAAMPPYAPEGDADDRPIKGLGFIFSAGEEVSIPPAVQAHNRRVAYAAALGGVAAASMLAFCAPFWLVSIRFYPFTFDLMLLFLIINLLLSYDQRGNLISLFFGVFLLGACSMESPLFLLLLPLGFAYLVRGMWLSEQASAGRLMVLLAIVFAGLGVAFWFLWQAAGFCTAISAPALRPILSVFLRTCRTEVMEWIPSFGWTYAFVQFLFPIAIGLFIFMHSFYRRTPLHFALQLMLVIILLPNLLNFDSSWFDRLGWQWLDNGLAAIKMDASLWNVARLTSKIPIYQYVIIALFVGLLVASWYLMREMKEEKLGEDLDWYEYRDHPIVCRIGTGLCWILLALAMLTPLLTYREIDSDEGHFVDEITEKCYQGLGNRDWVVNSRVLQHHLMIRAHRDGRQLIFISTDPYTGDSASARLVEMVKEQPAFASSRDRLINAAELSVSAFLRAWFRHETNAYNRVVLVNTPHLWRNNGFVAMPSGLFLLGVPQGEPIDVSAALKHHHAFCGELYPLVVPQAQNDIRYYSSIRDDLRRQLAYMANELGILLENKGRREDAVAIFTHARTVVPDNLSVVLNQYELAMRLGIQGEALEEIEDHLRSFQQKENTFAMTPAIVQAKYGTLLNPDVLKSLRETLWRRPLTFRNLVVTPSKEAGHADPLVALNNKRRELIQSVDQHLAVNEFDEADRLLSQLLSLDETHPFALANKARVAIELRNADEATLWLERAKANNVPEGDLLWHKAMLLYYDDKAEEARALIDDGLVSRADDVLLWGLLAKILLEAGEYNELEKRVYPALCSVTGSRDHYMVHMVRGYLLRHGDTENDQQARVCFLRALALNKHLQAVREDLLRLDDELDVPAFSEEDAKEMLRFDSEHAFANYLWGSVRLSRGELGLAEDLFTRSLEKEPNAPAYAGMGAVKFERGAFKDAETLLRQSLDLDDTRLFTRHTLARLLIATERHKEASAMLDTVLLERPTDFDIRLTLVELYMKQRKLEDAVRLISDLSENEHRLPQPTRKRFKQIVQELTNHLS